ncbi:terminase small subunit [Akkermansiaceae bacterium]|nr:terminase small subunit [Akkermansiaceae bacterium]
MNARQKKFADNYVKGMSVQQAYIKAGYGSKGRAASSAANKLLNIADIAEYIKELQQTDTNAALLTVEEKRLFLASAVRTPVENIDDKSLLCTGITYSKDGMPIIHSVDPIRAIQEDSRLAGHYAAEEVNVSVKGIGDLIDDIHAS